MLDDAIPSRRCASPYASSHIDAGGIDVHKLAHALNNRLASILALAELMPIDPEDREAMEDLGRMRDQVSAACELVRAMTHARQTPGPRGVGSGRLKRCLQGALQFSQKVWLHDESDGGRRGVTAEILALLVAIAARVRQEPERISGIALTLGGEGMAPDLRGSSNLRECERPRVVVEIVGRSNFDVETWLRAELEPWEELALSLNLGIVASQLGTRRVLTVWLPQA